MQLLVGLMNRLLGCIKPMVDLLETTYVKIVGVAMDAIEQVLKMGK